MRRFLLVLITIGIVVLIPAMSQAVESNHPQSPKNSQRNRWIVEPNVVVVTPVAGDLIVLGQDVRIEAPIEGDLFVAARTLTVSAPVKGSIRAVTTAGLFDAPVGHNLQVIAQEVLVRESTLVGWDAWMALWHGELRGTVTGNLTVYGDSLVLAGSHGGNVVATIDDQGQCVIQSTAKIQGDVVYRSPSEHLTIQPGAQILGSVRHEILQPPSAAGWDGGRLLKEMIMMFGLMIVGSIIVSTLPTAHMLHRVRLRVMLRPWATLVQGILITIVAPIVIVLLCLTVIGIPLAVILTMIALIISYCSTIIVGTIIGAHMVAAIDRKASLFTSMIMGVAVIRILHLVPVIGTALTLWMTFWTFGALWSMWRESLIHEHSG